MRGFVLEDWAKQLAQRQQCVQEIAETEAGKQCFAWLRNYVCRMDDPTFTQDPYEMAFREGRRSVWLEIQAEINKDTNEIIQQAEMLQRQEEARRRDQQRLGFNGEEYEQ